MKKAIIIGATSGIGREVAVRLLDKGWKVGVAGRRKEELDALQDRYGADRVHTAVLDVMQPDSAGALDRLIESLGSPDLLLYSSGIGRQNRELDIDLEVNTVRTNCEGMVRIVDHFLNHVRRSPDYSPSHKAQIAVISSVAGTEGMGSAPAYSATKKMQSTYLVALSQLCRMERIPAEFTDIRPGFVATAILNPNKRYPMLITVEKAADMIVRALERRKRVFIFDWKFRLIVLFWRLIPGCIWERMTFVKN